MGWRIQTRAGFKYPFRRAMALAVRLQNLCLAIHGRHPEIYFKTAEASGDFPFSAESIVPRRHKRLGTITTGKWERKMETALDAVSINIREARLPLEVGF